MTNMPQPHPPVSSPFLPSRLLYLAVFLGLIPWAVLVWKFNWVCDDAFISYRYSQHFALGHGLRYNLGSHTPVEGYSNLLWVLWISISEFLRLDPTIWARVTSVICGALLVAYVTRFTQRTFDLNFRETLSLSVFFSTLPGMAVWATGGLESMAACLLLFFLFERLLGNPDRPHGIHAGLGVVLLLLIRTDGAGFAVVVLGLGFLTWVVTRRQTLLRALLIAVTFFLIAMVLYLSWRYFYFEDYIPNTARIKGGISVMRIQRGSNYVVSFFLTVPSCLLVLLLSLLPKSRPLPSLAALSILIISANITYAVFVGGDFMTMGRFLLPLMPFLALLLSGTLQGLLRKHPLSATVLTLVLITLSLLPSFDLHPVPQGIREKFDFRWDSHKYQTEYAFWKDMKKNTRDWTCLGKALKKHTRPGDSIVLGTIGAQGYYSNLYIYDAFGLTSREVALRNAPPSRATPGHDRAVSPLFFLKHKPTYLGVVVHKKTKEQLAEVLDLWHTHPISNDIKIEAHPFKSDEDTGVKWELMLLRYLPQEKKE